MPFSQGLAFANIQLLSSQENQKKFKECKSKLKTAYDVVMKEDFEKDIRVVKAANSTKILVKVGKLLIEYPAEKQQNKESKKQRPKKRELGNGSTTLTVHS